MTCWLILGTLALSFTGTVHADKIAIIVQTGDDKDFLGFTKSARVARETFQKRGYERDGIHEAGYTHGQTPGLGCP